MDGVLEFENTKVAEIQDVREWAQSRNRYRCHVCLTRDEDGIVSAVVLNLPGCGSCGDDTDEAMQNVREAAKGVIESHLAAGESIPWVDSMMVDVPKGAAMKWIVVNV